MTDCMKGTMSKAVFTPSSLLSFRGALHLSQIILSLVTFLLAAFRGESLSYWNYAMFTWSFCPIMTLIITIIEMFKLDLVFNGICLDWPDFTTGMAMSSTLMTISAAIMYGNFYACLDCPYGWVVTVFAILCSVVYTLEVVKDKFLDKKKATYLAALPGFWKVLEAFVSCMIFVSLSGYSNNLALVLCVIAYAIPFPVVLLIIVINILKKLRTCFPFNLDRFGFIFLIVCVVLYIFAAIMWPIFTFIKNSRPIDCPRRFCIWAEQFMVAFMTYVNLILFSVDLIFTLLGICGFKRT
ncbi:myeloid-associated differentiation marker-like protein 2 [Antennarius striatus]|uniref:myeloid-associated differentiation marker-like protein 2 n=1 Tax=Antennarius striatus TaxID=241820 RepID=UPI0035B37453